jgi:phosphoserine phosphatase
VIKNIIWDFDNTLIPIDSERMLMSRVFFRNLFRGRIWWCISKSPWILAGGSLYLLGGDYKWVKRYIAKIYTGADMKDLLEIARGLGKRIPAENIAKVREAHKKRYKNYVISCGSTQPIKEMLKTAGILGYFDGVYANTIIVKKGKIEGYTYEVANKKAKLDLMKKLGLKSSQTMAIGDGKNEIDLFNNVAKSVVYGNHLGMMRIAKKRKWPVVSSMSEVKL